MNTSTVLLVLKGHRLNRHLFLLLLKSRGLGWTWWPAHTFNLVWQRHDKESRCVSVLGLWGLTSVTGPISGSSSRSLESF